MQSLLLLFALTDTFQAEDGSERYFDGTDYTGTPICGIFPFQIAIVLGAI